MGTSSVDREGKLRRLADILDAGIGAGLFPGGVAARRSRGEPLAAARGTLEYPGASASPAAVSADTVYDLASLTKILATLPLALLTIQAGRAELDAPVAGLLPELSAGLGAGWNRTITIRRLLAHTSGLPAWRPYYIRHRDKAAYLSAIADEEPAYEPGSAVEYSDLGFMLLGWALERAWDDDLPALARRLVWKPLGMGRTDFRPASSSRLSAAECAPTEDGNAHERGMALAYAAGQPVVGGVGRNFPLSAAEVEAFPWREGVIRGEAHDGNCHYGLDGASGHAGAFSTAADLARFPAFWDEGGPLSPALRAAAFSRQTPSGSVARGLGWILEDGGWATHTGFSGTSIRYRPADGDAVVALTNRVHPRVSDGIGPWREALAREGET